LTARAQCSSVLHLRGRVSPASLPSAPLRRSEGVCKWFNSHRQCEKQLLHYISQPLAKVPHGTGLLATVPVVCTPSLRAPVHVAPSTLQLAMGGCCDFSTRCCTLDRSHIHALPFHITPHVISACSRVGWGCATLAFTINPTEQSRAFRPRPPLYSLQPVPAAAAAGKC
jgi:hypothetical protein